VRAGLISSQRGSGKGEMKASMNERTFRSYLESASGTLGEGIGDTKVPRFIGMDGLTDVVCLKMADLTSFRVFRLIYVVAH
jgi:hypothetical protein